MRGRDMVLAAFASVIWGGAFPVATLALASFGAAELVALRFLIAALPALVVPRPAVPWPMLVAIGATLFAGQFLLFFFALALGLPPGLASVTQQAQAFITVALAVILMGDQPTVRQCIGMTAAAGGLVLIGCTVGGDLTWLSLGLALGGATSWAIGNLLVKRHPDVPIFPLTVWASLVPPLPALVVAALIDGRMPLVGIADASWTSLCAALYLGTAATMLAYALWGGLLQRHPAGAVAPFALIAPVTGIAGSALIFGEVFPTTRYAGMALVLLGLAIAVLPARYRVRGRRLSPDTGT